MRNEKPKIIIGSIVLYVAASVAAVIAVALLVNNILLFKNIVTQYTAQGYERAEVLKQLVPSQLLPGIFQSVGLYGGIAVILAGAGMIYQKVSKLAGMLAAVGVEGYNAEDVVMENNPVEMDNTEAAEQIKEDIDSI